MGVLSVAKVGRRRAQEPCLTKAEATRVAKSATKTVGDALAASTWRGIEATHRRLVQFKELWLEATGVDLPWDLAIVYWVQRLMMSAESPLSTASALEYVMRAKSALRRMGTVVESQMLLDFVRGLKRQGALRPSKQAKPATEAQVADALEGATEMDTALALVLAWSGAARVSDVLRLRVRDVTFEEGFVAINWSDTKSDPFRLGVTTGISLPPRWRTTLRQRIDGRDRESVLLDSSYRKVVAALKRTDADLSGHSLRRGALAALLEQDVALHTMQQVSRHSSLDALARYLPAGKLTVARQSAEASRLLGTRL